MQEMMDIIDIARLEEARLARGIREIADEAISVGVGGVACRAAPGSWANNTVGVGMSGPVDRAELEAVSAWYADAGIEPRFELCPYADASALRGLSDLGFIVRGFENVLFRELRPGDRFETVRPAPTGLKIERVGHSDERMIRAYVETVTPQFFPPGATPKESDFEVASRCLRLERTVSLAAVMDGKVVAGGGMEWGEGGIAALWGLAVAPEYRRRGIQQALIAERLRLAQQRGVRVATIGSRPGQGTERNVRRMGFQVGYTKIALVRPGDGLAPVVE